MAAFGYFCLKIIWDKYQFLVPINRKSEKIKTPSKGGLKSESAGGFSIAIINIPFYYPKLLRPVYGIDQLHL